MRGGALIYSSPLIDRFSYCIHCWLSVSSQLIRTHWRSALTRPRSITRYGKPRPYPCFFFWNINFTTLQRDWIFRRNFRSPPILRKSRVKIMDTKPWSGHRFLSRELHRAGSNPPWLFPNPFSCWLLDEDEDTGAKKRERTDEERSEKLFPCKVPRGLARGYEILMAHKM